MKTTLTNFLTIASIVMLGHASYAQVSQNTTEGRPAGLDDRVTIATDQPVKWSKSQYGFAGLYKVGDTQLMATYDNNSIYLETYEEINWNDTRVSSLVKSSLAASLYKDLKVASYWQSSDPEENGYYLVMQDKNGKQSEAWVDAKG